MCDPVTLTVVATGLAVAGGAVTMNAQMQAGAYQAQVANNQAKMVEQKALVEEHRKREETAQIISQQRAKYAASGIDPNMGSAENVQVSSALVGELDALTIRTNAKNEAAGLRSQGAAAKALGNAQAFSTALGTASQVAGTWSSFLQTPTVPKPGAGITQNMLGVG